MQGNRSRRSTARQPELKFYPHGNGKYQQTATYGTVKDHIVQCAQKTFPNGQDIAVSLRDLKKKDLNSDEPSRDIATDGDDTIKKMKQDGMDILCQAEITKYLDRKEMPDQNMSKACALIFSNYCNKTMQNRVEEHPEYESKIRDDPIALLEAIKTLMHDPIRAKYPCASLTEAISRAMNIKQTENENLLDCVKRFKQQRDIMKSHVGTNILDTFAENMPEHRNETDTNKQDEMKKSAFERWTAHLPIRNSDQAKYGSLMSGLISQYSMDHDQYPKTVTAATDVLSSHRHDNRKKWNIFQKIKKG